MVLQFLLALHYMYRTLPARYYSWKASRNSIAAPSTVGPSWVSREVTAEACPLLYEIMKSKFYLGTT